MIPWFGHQKAKRKEDTSCNDNRGSRKRIPMIRAWEPSYDRKTTNQTGIEGPLLRQRQGGTWESDHHEHEIKDHDHVKDEHTAEVNPHIWLNPLQEKTVTLFF